MIVICTHCYRMYPGSEEQANDPARHCPSCASAYAQLQLECEQQADPLAAWNDVNRWIRQHQERRKEERGS